MGSGKDEEDKKLFSWKTWNRDLWSFNYSYRSGCALVKKDSEFHSSLI